MALDKEIQIRVSIDPFQELDEKKLALMQVKEIGLKDAKRINLSEKIAVTSVKWDKRKLEDAFRAICRYELALFASQMWQAYRPYEKAKNGQDKFKAAKTLVKFAKDSQKGLEKTLKQKLAEFKEEMAAGASDDLGELKKAQKALTADTANKIMTYANSLREGFLKEITTVLRPLRVAEVKASGEAKAKATQELQKAIKKSGEHLEKMVDDAESAFEKLMNSLLAAPGNMSKSSKKDISDAAKAEYSASSEELTKALKPVEKHIASAKKNNQAVLRKIQNKDFSKSTVDLSGAALLKISTTASKLADAIAKINARLKKLEQAVKKR